MSQPAFDFDDGLDPDAVGEGGVDIDEPADPTYTVGELADAIDNELRRGFRDGVWVRGEINGLKRGGPHIYFSLVEKDRASEAKIEVKLFAPSLNRLTPKLRKHRLDLRDGMKVRIHGFLDFYKPRGTLGVKMNDIDTRYTLGEIAQSRDEIMRRLVASGLIDVNKRRPLSPIPLRVGVAASVESAAWADFRSELERSGFGFELTVADTRVQGDGADRMVAGALGTLARGARAGLLDVIVVIRGGGARNELAVFDSERIAHTIAAVPVPVFTGLGHEIDRSIADEVAHTALKTPTACAGALIEQVDRYAADTELAFEQIVRRSLATADGAERGLHDLARRITGHTSAAVERAGERLNMRHAQLTAAAPTAVKRASDRLDAASARLLERAIVGTERATARLDVCEARTASLDPAVQLARGWSITRDAAGRVVGSTADVVDGATMSTTLIDGEVTSVVSAVHHRSPSAEADADAAPESDRSDA